MGPPSSVKTSLGGKSIASALGRKNIFECSLGGLHDEAEIRGHSKNHCRWAMQARFNPEYEKVKKSQIRYLFWMRSNKLSSDVPEVISQLFWRS